MTQIIPHQQQPVAQLAQGIEDIQGLQNTHVTPPPVALGSRHSIGQTIARIVLAIFSFGLSELVICTFKAALVNQANARAQLPENQPPVVTDEPNIATLNASKADSLGSKMPIVDAGKNRATAIFGTAATLDNATFMTTLQKAIKDCPTEVTDEALGRLAETVARDMLTKSIMHAVVSNEPLNVNLTDEKKNILTDGYLRLPQAIALKGADNEEAMVVLLDTVKDMVKESALSVVANTEAKQILFPAGIQKFAELTGLAPGSFTLNVRSLENKLAIAAQKLDDDAVTLEKPYAKASKDAIMADWQPKTEAFFANRAEAYNSIATMNISAALKKDFQKLCLSSKESIQSDTFTKAMAITTTVTTDTSLNGLLDPDLSTEDKIAIMETFAIKQHEATVAAFGAERMTGMGADSRALVVGISYKMIFAQRPALLAELANNPALLNLMAATMQDRVSTAMDAARSGQRNTVERVLGTDEAFQLLRVAAQESIPQVIVAPAEVIVAPAEVIVPFDEITIP